jgi:hypothetical protein
MSSGRAAARLTADAFSEREELPTPFFGPPTLAGEGDVTETEADLDSRLTGFKSWASQVSDEQFLAALHADISSHGPADGERVGR